MSALKKQDEREEMLKKDFEFKTAKLIGSHEPGSAEWHELRQGAVGGSQVGTILGLNPWESAVTAFYKATGQIDDHIEPSLAMRIGTKLEQPILELFEEQHPELNIYTTGTYASLEDERFHANPDALYEREDGSIGLIEVKTSQKFWYEVPPSYRKQVMWYMHILGLKHCYIVALVAGSYQEHEITYEQFEAEAMVQGVKEFLACVESGQVPSWDGSNSTYETIRALHPEIDVEDSVELGDLGIHLSNAYAELEQQQIKYRELQSRTLDAMGNAKWGLIDDRPVIYRTSRNGGSPYLQWKKGE